jgi:hypothetical protein
MTRLHSAVLNQRCRNLTAKAITEFKRLIMIFIYLWAVFGLFVLDQTVILGERHIDYKCKDLR